MILRLLCVLIVTVGIWLGNMAAVMAKSENPITETQITLTDALRRYDLS